MITELKAKIPNIHVCAIPKTTRHEDKITVYLTGEDMEWDLEMTFRTAKELRDELSKAIEESVERAQRLMEAEKTKGQA